MEIDEVYTPLERFHTEFREKFARLTAETFEKFRRDGNVDPEANAVLVREIHDLEEKKKKANFRKNWLIFLQVIDFLLAIAACFIAYAGSSAGDGLLITAALVGAVFFAIAMIFWIVPTLKNVNRHLQELADAIEKKKTEAWKQMAPMNRFFDWGTVPGLIEKTMPHIRFDPFFSVERLQDLYNSFGWNDQYNHESSVLCAHSGVLYGYPFVLAELLKMEWGEKTYTGELIIHWTERALDLDGHYRTVRRSEILTASVTKPIPVYKRDKFLLYGNENAPELSFSRAPSKFSGCGDGFFAKIQKKYELKKLHDFEQNLKDDSNYTMMGNRDFELLFHATDRTDEVGFRLLFTPLAQQNMVKLLQDKKIGYGDDFYFWKQHMYDIIAADHLAEVSLDLNPRQFLDFDLARAKKYFQTRCETFFKAVYFLFAPLLTIPMYQEQRPLKPESPYGEEPGGTASFWELEALANQYGTEVFQHPDCVTSCILKTWTIKREGDGHAVVGVRAHGYRCVERTKYVSVYGGDGHFHDVPVNWIDYLPVERDSKLSVMEINEFSRPDLLDETKNEAINAFCRRHGIDRGKVSNHQRVLSHIIQ